MYVYIYIIFISYIYIYVYTRTIYIYICIYLCMNMYVIKYVCVCPLEDDMCMFYCCVVLRFFRSATMMLDTWGCFLAIWHVERGYWLRWTHRQAQSSPTMELVWIRTKLQGPFSWSTVLIWSWFPGIASVLSSWLAHDARRRLRRKGVTFRNQLRVIVQQLSKDGKKTIIVFIKSSSNSLRAQVPELCHMVKRMLRLSWCSAEKLCHVPRCWTFPSQIPPSGIGRHELSAFSHAKKLTRCLCSGTWLASGTIATNLSFSCQCLSCWRTDGDQRQQFDKEFHGA